MKSFLASLALVLLIIVAPVVHAQKPVVELPELQEWYSWSGSAAARISYFPNFSDNGGANAVTQPREGDPTWFNRFAFDTVNQFSWNGGSWTVAQVDFNADGISDYIDGEGRVYKGIEKGKPPGAGFGKYERGGDNPFVADFNNDGYEDVLTPSKTSKTFRIIFGGQDLTHLSSTVVSYLYGENYPTGIAAYINENGKPRMLVYSLSAKSEGFYLFGITFNGSPSDSIIVNLNELDKVVQDKKTIDERFIDGNSFGFYENKKTKEYTLLVSYLTSKTLIPYAIINDKFVTSPVLKISRAAKFCLPACIDGGDEPNWINYTLPSNVYSGNPAKDATPRMTIKLNNCDLDGMFSYIGDVTGDGIGDVAFGSINCFTVFKGIDWRKLSFVQELVNPDFTLHQTEPNPIGSEGRAVLPVTLAHDGIYTLTIYDLTGKHIGELFSGDLPRGEVKLPLDVKTLHLNRGMYTLRLSDGKYTQERAFIFQP